MAWERSPRLLLAQLQLPRLSDELFPESIVALLLDELKARALIDAAGGGEHALGPQRDLAVARLARKAQRLLHQSGADAEPARLGLDQEKAQPRDLLCVPHQQNRSDILALALGDPAALALAIMVADEGRDDFRRQRFDPLVPAVFLPVKRAVTGHDPTHVAGAGSRQHIGGLRRGAFGTPG